MKTQLIFNEKARAKLLKGVNLLADAVAMTLGPRGRNVAIAKCTPKGEVYERKVVDDGVGVAKAIDLKDEFESMGAALIRESAQKQVDEVGDGTTAVIILAREIVNQCIAQIAKGINPMELRLRLEEDTKKLIKKLEKLARPIKSIEDKMQVATISSKDPEIGKLIADTYEKVGVDGVITVEESKMAETVVEHQEGMQFDKGYVSLYFITNPQTMTATLEETYVLVTDMTLSNFMDLVPFLKDQFLPKAKVLTVIAPEFTNDVLPSFIQNKIDGHFLSLCVTAPSFGQNMKNTLEDIAILTGGKFISADVGYSLKDLKFEDLGQAKRITSSKSETIIVGGRGDKQMIKDRIEQIKKQIEDEEVEFDREKLKERLGKLSNGIAVIKVGGQTEIEMKERWERATDAVSATRCAIKDGVVAGGEVVYLNIRNIVKDNPILYHALKKPFLQLLENSGLDNNEIMFNINNPVLELGVDVTDGKVKNMVEAGIVDPMSVAKQAILNSVSVAIQIMICGAIIVPEIKEEK
jgi:chaperonin GroEL